MIYSLLSFRCCRCALAACEDKQHSPKLAFSGNILDFGGQVEESQANTKLA